MTDFLRGIDIAHYEPVIQWEMLRKQDLHFAFIKATEGLTFRDDKFSSHWAGAKGAGLLRGAYHFLRPDLDGRKQAEFFLSIVFPNAQPGAKIQLEPGDLPLVLDLEDIFEEVPDKTPGKKGVKNTQGKGKTGGRTVKRPIQYAPAQIVKCCENWLKTVEERTGCKAIIYSRATYLIPNLLISGKPPAWSMDHVLWLAQYHPKDPEQFLPMADEAAGWQKWSFWQYSQHSKVPGILDDLGRMTGVDLNYYRGSLQELYALANSTPPADGVVVQPQAGDLEEVKADNVVIPPPVTPAGKPVPAPSLTYTIQAGDTIFGLARKFNTTQEAILAANPQITNPNLIHIGDILNIPQG